MKKCISFSNVIPHQCNITLWNRVSLINFQSALWILMAWCFSTRTLVATLLSMHLCVSSGILCLYAHANARVSTLYQQVVADVQAPGRRQATTTALLTTNGSVANVEAGYINTVPGYSIHYINSDSWRPQEGHWYILEPPKYHVT